MVGLRRGVFSKHMWFFSFCFWLSTIFHPLNLFYIIEKKMFYVIIILCEGVNLSGSVTVQCSVRHVHNYCIIRAHSLYSMVDGVVQVISEKKRLLKADWPHLRNYPPTPTDYRHTDKHLRLVMAPIALNCTRQSRDRRTDGQTDGRYQVHYLPRFAVDKNMPVCSCGRK